MKKIALSLLLAACLSARSASAQTTTLDIALTISAALANTTTIATITASQGSGTSCVISKIPAPTPIGLVTCIGGDGKALTRPTFILTNGSAVVNTGLISFNDVTILWALNATTAAVTLGSMGSVPANNLGISYTTGVKTTGGQTTPVTIVTAWP